VLERFAEAMLETKQKGNNKRNIQGIVRRGGSGRRKRIRKKRRVKGHERADLSSEIKRNFGGRCAPCRY
jgi:hypothetical protein